MLRLHAATESVNAVLVGWGWVGAIKGGQGGGAAGGGHLRGHGGRRRQRLAGSGASGSRHRKSQSLTQLLTL